MEVQPHVLEGVKSPDQLAVASEGGLREGSSCTHHYWNTDLHVQDAAVTRRCTQTRLQLFLVVTHQAEDVGTSRLWKCWS